jgi:hypothetical protein
VCDKSIDGWRFRVPGVVCSELWAVEDKNEAASGHSVVVDCRHEIRALKRPWLCITADIAGISFGFGKEVSFFSCLFLKAMIPKDCESIKMFEKVSKSKSTKDRHFRIAGSISILKRTEIGLRRPQDDASSQGMIHTLPLPAWEAWLEIQAASRLF